MNAEFELKLQAYLDDEVSEAEAREVELRLADDEGARALLAELRHTSSALVDYQNTIQLPESREFYWSKIQRAIEQAERPVPPRAQAVPWWRRFLIPAGAVAALAIAGLLSLRQLSPTETPVVETFLADSGAMTYRDEVERMTVVWLPYPAQNDFANRNWDDTLN